MHHLCVLKYCLDSWGSCMLPWGWSRRRSKHWWEMLCYKHKIHSCISWLCYLNCIILWKPECGTWQCHLCIYTHKSFVAFSSFGLSTFTFSVINTKVCLSYSLSTIFMHVPCTLYSLLTRTPNTKRVYIYIYVYCSFVGLDNMLLVQLLLCM
jgi:hypothetical protein